MSSLIVWCCTFWLSWKGNITYYQVDHIRPLNREVEGHKSWSPLFKVQLVWVNLPQNHWLCREKKGIVEITLFLTGEVELSQVPVVLAASRNGVFVVFLIVTCFLLLELDRFSAWTLVLLHLPGLRKRKKTFFFCRKTVAWKSLFNKLQSGTLYRMACISAIRSLSTNQKPANERHISWCSWNYQLDPIFTAILNFKNADKLLSILAKCGAL